MIRFLIALLLFTSPVVFATELVDANVLEERLAEIERKQTKLDQKQSNLDQQVASGTRRLESRLEELEDDAAAGIGLFISGIICALWAQYTRRSGWLWFFFGLFLAPVALIAMVWKNALELASGELKYWTRD